MSETMPNDAPKRLIDSWNELEERQDNQFVKINRAALDKLIEQNPNLNQPDWLIPSIHPNDDWAFANQIVVANTINYMFLNKDIERDGESWTMRDPLDNYILSGSTAMLTRTTQLFGEASDISWAKIINLATPSKFEEFLPDIPMADTRREKLANFALGIRDYYDGSVRSFLESTIDDKGDFRIFNNGQGMVDRMLSEEFGDVFADTSYIEDLEFPFNKRANLTPILIDGRARISETLPTVGDMDQSGTVIDYRLPQALRELGVLEYDSLLEQSVDSYEHIPAGSRAEVEIRAASASAVVYLLENLNMKREAEGKEPYTMAHIDFWLWKLGRELKKNGSQSLPHYTETTSY